MISLDLKVKIYQYLQTNCRGESSAKTGSSIAKEFETEWRAVAGVIRQLRLDGVLIGSNKGSSKTLTNAPKKLPGYFIPVTKEEVDNYFKSFKDELFDMLKTFNRQKRAKMQFITNQQSKDLFSYKYAPSGQLELTLSAAR
jgi:Holliday junction resolvase RusA-like endonuclease